MTMTDVIVSDPDVMGGTPTVRGSRLTVYAIQGRIEGGDPIEDLLDEYAYIPLHREDIEAALMHAHLHPREERLMFKVKFGEGWLRVLRVLGGLMTLCAFVGWCMLTSYVEKRFGYDGYWDIFVGMLFFVSPLFLVFITSVAIAAYEWFHEGFIQEGGTEITIISTETEDPDAGHLSLQRAQGGELSESK